MTNSFGRQGQLASRPQREPSRVQPVVKQRVTAIEVNRLTAEGWIAYRHYLELLEN
jgi:hypothetical protein